jgi:hypothetical protein
MAQDILFGREGWTWCLDVVEMDPLTINPTAAFLKKDHQVKYFYQASVLDEVFEELCDCEYATEMCFIRYII